MIKFLTKDSGQALAGMMRDDKIFASKYLFSKKLRKLIEGFAVEIARTEGITQEIWDEYDITSTTKLIQEWENALGIPDDCFMIADNIVDRRQNVFTKLTALGVSLKGEFEDLALKLGLTVTVSPGAETLIYPYTFPVVFTNINPKWGMLVTINTGGGTAETFPYLFPFILGEGEKIKLLICLFQKLVPSVVQVVFNII